MVLTNVLGPALLIRAALPELRRTAGRIALVGSVAGTIYSEGNIYGATKWAVTAMAEAECVDVNTLTIRPIGAAIA
jgi:NADP-dependent 3-hydroxy acid dehydrogenase YdfG